MALKLDADLEAKGQLPYELVRKMESESQSDREDEEICLEIESEADRSEPALETTGSETDSGLENEEVWHLPELRSDRHEPRLETRSFENPDENEEVWHLPELRSDRHEPVLEMRSFENRDGTGIGWSVYLGRPSESFNCMPIPGMKGEEFSLLLGTPRSKDKIKLPDKEVATKRLIPDEAIEDQMVVGSAMYTADMEMGEHKSGLDEGVSALKSKLTKQGHGPEKDNNFPQDAHRSMKVNDVSDIADKKKRLKPKLTKRKHGPKKVYELLQDACHSVKANEVSDNAIFKQRTPSGNTVLHLAASYGNDAMVEKVAQHAPRLFTVPNNHYDTALHVAAKTGDGATIKLLLNEFLLFVRRQTNGHRHQSILELMLMVSLTLFRNKQGNTFLHEAFMTSNHNGAVILEAFEAPFIDGDSNKFDEARYKKVVHDLATFEVNMEGKSLLYLTIEANCEQGVNQLMDSCTKGYLKPKGKSPLLPALINKNLGMLRTILSKKKHWIHLRNEQGWLPLHHAVLLGYLQGVLYLVEECPFCTMERDNKCSLPIHLACMKGHVKIVQKLLGLCLDPADMANNGQGQNLLHIACTYGKYELVRHLLEDPKLEIMINQKDINGNTPLHLATYSWHPKIVHELTWDKRVDLSVLNHDNLTALDIAEVRQGRNVSLSQRLTWNALVSAGTPRSSERFHSNVGTNGTTSDSASTHDGTQTTEPYKDRIDTLTVVSTLIIATSFAAGFTIPGDVDHGIPVLLNRHVFYLFILSLTFSFFGAISSTIILMWARLGDLHLAVFALDRAIPLLGLSLTSLFLAFLSGMYLIVSKLSWLATTFLVIGVVLILIVVFLYSLLLLPSTSSLPFIRCISYYPFRFFANIAEGKMDPNKMVSKAIIPVL